MAKVLVIEDDKFLANAYQIKLTKAGFDVRIALNGDDGVKTFNEFGPNLIVLDLIMPQKDGFEVLKEIRASSKGKNVPIIVASNLGQKEDIDKGTKLGATDYIIKSELSMDELVKKIKSLI